MRTAFVRVLFLVFLADSPSLAQSFQLIKPDIATGRPLLVATPCAEPSEFETWVPPISAYEDPGIELYIDETCVNLNVLTFSSRGKYSVSLYTHYKDSDWPCKRGLPQNPTPEEAKAIRQLQTFCKTIVYKVSHLEVDTRAAKYRMSEIMLLDSHGYLLSSPGSGDWHDLTYLDRDDYRPLKLAIARTTKLVEKEAAYWTERLKRRQP